MCAADAWLRFPDDRFALRCVRCRGGSTALVWLVGVRARAPFLRSWL